MAENPGPFQVNPVISKMLEYVVKDYAEQRRLEQQRRELEKQKSDPKYEEGRRQLERELAALAAEKAAAAAKEAEHRRYMEKYRDLDLSEDAKRRMEEKYQREEEWRERERQDGERETEDCVDDASKKFDGAEGNLEPKPRMDPLALDLDGDGIETTDLSHGAFFDHDKNGLAELSSWVSKDDGLLVMDRNDDGIINDGGELFGDQTILKSGLKASNGFEALAELDTNGDGKIDAHDQPSSRLRVWRDSNGDGYSSPEELHSLEELGIKSINIQSEVVNAVDEQLNITQRRGTFDKVDGSTGQVAEYGFYQETTYTVANEWRVVPQDVSAMPILWGYGNVYDLHQAIVRDESGQLKTLVGAFATVTDPSAREALLAQILFKWTGTEDIEPQSRGNNIDARKLSVLEEFFGKRWVGQSGSNPDANASVLLNDAYRGMFEFMYAQLMIQTHLRGVIGEIVWSMDPATGALQIDDASVDGMLNHLLTNVVDNPEQGRLLLSEFSRTLRGLGFREEKPGYLAIREFFVQQDPSLGWVFDTGGLSVIDHVGQGVWPSSHHIMGTDGSEAIRGSLTEGDGCINGQYGNDVIYGTDRNETLFSMDGDSLLFGGGGADHIWAGAGNDILDGGTGSDILYGEEGDDTYIFRRGSGRDTIIETDTTAGNVDTIWIGSFLTPDDIAVKRSGNDLVFKIIGSDDTMTVKSWFDAASLGFQQVEQVQFADGTTWDVNEMLLRQSQPTEGDDYLTGDTKDNTIDALGGDDVVIGQGGNDTLRGGSGSDQLFGGAGNDVLEGGTGSDILDGGSGNNTYIFGRGSGQDTVKNLDASPGKVDTVLFTDVLPSEVSLSRRDNDMIISITNSDDTLTVVDWFKEAESQCWVGMFQFSDGTVWDATAIRNVFLAGTEGNDRITGFNASDTIQGLGGNDSIDGSGGADTIDGGAGNDQLYGAAGSDTLKGGDGSDMLLGGAGDDVLDGGADNDHLYGGAGYSDNPLVSNGDDTYLFAGPPVLFDRSSVGSTSVYLKTGLYACA